MKDWLNIDKLEYNTYDEYKDSKIEWLGYIPNHFKINKIKNDFKVFNGNSIKEDKKNNFIDNNIGINFIGTKDINNFKINYNSELKIPKQENFKLLEEYTPLLCIEGGSAGKKIAITNQKIHFGNKLCSFNNNSILLKKYMYYYLQSQPFQLQFNNELSGMIEGVSIGIIRNLYNTVISKKEQLVIVKFLNEKTTIIDKKIEILKKQNKLEKELEKVLINQCVTKGVDSFTKLDKNGNLIDFDNKLNRNKEEFDLYMNENGYIDSKIELIGNIPRSFKTNKVKNELKEAKYTTVEEGLRNYLEIGDINIKNKDYDIKNKEKLTVKGAKKVPINTILVSTVRPNRGAITYTKEEGVCVSTAFTKINMKNKYYFYYLNRVNFFEYLINNSQGSTYPICKDYDVLQYHLCVPSKKEQLEIVKFLDNKTQILEQKRIKREKEITLLEEYKKTLINDVVTGKIKVIKD